MARVSRRLLEIARRRADGRCEYCRLPESASSLPFQPDHVIAVKHRGRTDEANLAWSCFYCNSYKGACIAGRDQNSGKMSRLFHPRFDDWRQHFRWSGPVLTGLTPIGRTTVQVLNINHPDSVRLRRSLLRGGLF
jgi:HNH endonuclease